MFGNHDNYEALSGALWARFTRNRFEGDNKSAPLHVLHGFWKLKWTRDAAAHACSATALNGKSLTKRGWLWTPGCVVSGLSGLYVANSPANSQSWTKWNGNANALPRKIKDKVAQMSFTLGKGERLRRSNFPFKLLFNILACKLPAWFRLIFAGPCTNFMQEPMTCGGLKASHGQKSRSCARWSNLGPVLH